MFRRGVSYKRPETLFPSVGLGWKAGGSVPGHSSKRMLLSMLALTIEAIAHHTLLVLYFAVF